MPGRFSFSAADLMGSNLESSRAATGESSSVEIDDTEDRDLEVGEAATALS